MFLSPSWHTGQCLFLSPFNTPIVQSSFLVLDFLFYRILFQSADHLTLSFKCVLVMCPLPQFSVWHPKFRKPKLWKMMFSETKALSLRSCTAGKEGDRYDSTASCAKVLSGKLSLFRSGYFHGSSISPGIGKKDPEPAFQSLAGWNGVRGQRGMVPLLTGSVNLRKCISCFFQFHEIAEVSK